MPARTYADIEPLEPEWLIPGLVPKSFVTMIVGDGGVGKGQLWADWTGCITSGRRLPGVADADKSARGSVLLVTSEDDANMSTAWRLRAASADLGHVYDITEDFSIPESLPALDEKISEIGDVRLVVIDPLADNLGFVPGSRRQVSLSSGNVTLRRYVMRPLEALARRHGVGLIVIHHTVKSGRMAGSKGISDAARMVLRITRPDESQPLRVITVEKTNIAGGADRIGYTIGGEWPDVHVAYIDGPQDEDTGQRVTVADQVLAHLQSADGPLTPQEIASQLGVSYGATRIALSRRNREGLIHSPERGSWCAGPMPVTSLHAVTSNK